MGTFKWCDRRKLEKHPIHSHNIFKVKMEGITPVQAKVRSVVTGSTEPYYGETFASTPFASSLKTFLAMTASHGMYLSVGDVGAAFVSTCIDAEGISVIAPPGVVPQPNDPGYDDIMKNKVPENFGVCFEKITVRVETSSKIFFKLHCILRWKLPALYPPLRNLQYLRRSLRWVMSVQWSTKASR